MPDKVLLVSRGGDYECLDRVAAHIHRLGGEAIRREITADSPFQNGLSGISAVWHHCPVVEHPPYVRGVLRAIEGFHLNSESSTLLALQKTVQAQLARDAGFEVPRTITTNDPELARAFAASCPLGAVVKMGTDTQSGSLRTCPMTFQEKLRKSLDLRVMVIGTRVFAAARKPDDPASEWFGYPLDRSAEQQVLSIIDGLGLDYGILQLATAASGRLILHDISPSGALYRLETGGPRFPLTQTIAQLLLGQLPARKNAAPSIEPLLARAITA